MIKILRCRAASQPAARAARHACCCTKHQQQTFDTKVDEFKAKLPGHIQEKLNRIATSASLTSEDERVLDVGSGTGCLIPYIQETGPRDILAIDVSPKMLAEVTSKHGEASTLGNDKAVRTWLGPFEELPAHQGRAKAIFMNAVFGNLADPRGALWHACTLLNPGGRIVISHPEGRGWHTAFRQQNPELVPHALPDHEELHEMISDLPLQLESFADDDDFYCAVLACPPDFQFEGAPLHLQVHPHFILLPEGVCVKGVSVVQGKVVEGFQRGSKQMGVPTANLLPTDVEDSLAQFPYGVYFGWAQLQRDGDKETRMAVMNYGKRPTVKDGSHHTVEVHILGSYDEDFYGEQLHVTLLGFIRPEIKFKGLGELVNRIQQDIGIAKQQLSSEEARKWKTRENFS